MVLGVVLLVLGVMRCVSLMMCLGWGVALQLSVICVGASCMFVVHCARGCWWCLGLFVQFVLVWKVVRG